MLLSPPAGRRRMYTGAMMWGNNRNVLVNSISGGDTRLKKLLDAMSTKELVILWRHDDLIVRVRKIFNMTLVEASAELKDEYGLEIDAFECGDTYVSTEKLEGAVPDWYRPFHVSGWILNLENGKFLDWAKNLLLQDVRINLWVRYMEHKKNSLTASYTGGTYI